MQDFQNKTNQCMISSVLRQPYSWSGSIPQHSFESLHCHVGGSSNTHLFSALFSVTPVLSDSPLERMPPWDIGVYVATTSGVFAWLRAANPRLMQECTASSAPAPDLGSRVTVKSWGRKQGRERKVIYTMESWGISRPLGLGLACLPGSQ